MIAVVDFIGNVVKTASLLTQKEIGKEVFYQYGHIREINETLTSYSKTEEFRKQKYPAIFLLQDFAEKMGIDEQYETKVSLQLLIVSGSATEYRSADRYEKVFKPILYPIYSNFIKSLGQNPDLMKSYNGFPHEKIDRPLVSGALVETTKGVANLFNDNLDAIEIRNLNLIILKKCI